MRLGKHRCLAIIKCSFFFNAATRLIPCQENHGDGNDDDNNTAAAADDDDDDDDDDATVTDDDDTLFNVKYH